MKLLEYTSGDGYAALEFDAVEEEGYEFAAETTEHAVEEGAPIVDHARRVSDTVTLRAWISNRPLFLPRGAASGVTVDTAPRTLGVAGRTFQATTLAPSGPYDRVGEAHALLEALVGNGLCRYTGSLETTTDDVIVTRYTTKRTAEVGGALEVNLDLKRIRFATTDRQAVAPRQRRALPAEERGAQPARLQSAGYVAGREAAAAVRDAARSMGFGS